MISCRHWISLCLLRMGEICRTLTVRWVQPVWPSLSWESRQMSVTFHYLTLQKFVVKKSRDYWSESVFQRDGQIIFIHRFSLQKLNQDLSVSGDGIMIDRPIPCLLLWKWSERHIKGRINYVSHVRKCRVGCQMFGKSMSRYWSAGLWGLTSAQWVSSHRWQRSEACSESVCCSESDVLMEGWEWWWNLFSLWREWEERKNKREDESRGELRRRGREEKMREGPEGWGKRWRGEKDGKQEEGRKSRKESLITPVKDGWRCACDWLLRP